MDPLTALSLAGTIVQFIDFGGKLVGGAVDIYRSPKGSLEVNDEIEFVAADLRELVDKLREGVSESEDEKDCNALSNSGKKQRGDPLGGFKSLCDRSAAIADEITAKLEGLKLSGEDENGPKKSSFRKFRSLKMAMKTLWSKREISELMERLSKLREALDTQVLVSIRQAIDAQDIQKSNVFDKLDPASQHIVSTIVAAQAQAAAETTLEVHQGMKDMMMAIAQLLRRIEAGERDNHLLRDEILDRIQERDKHAEAIVPSVELFDVSYDAEKSLRHAVNQAILKGLSYDTMSTRYEDIGEAHPETFEWVFSDPKARQRPWSSFPDWLTTGYSMYWMTGKAGCGKSTLMKFVFDDKRTRECLEAWAGDVPLVMATFFFWNSGSKEQKSQSGFLRALLFQVLSERPELIVDCLPTDWARVYLEAARGNLDVEVLKLTWPLRKLVDALQAVIRQTSVPLKLFFLVDGLDEFDGDHDEIAGLFNEITKSTTTKACVASRPLIVFEEAFRTCSKLRLHDLTRPDIEKFVGDKLHQNSAFKKLSIANPQETYLLVDDIVEKAEGVFLWVRLVVQSLLAGIRNRDGFDDLWGRVRRFPRDLDPLYEHLLESIEPGYLSWAAEAFLCLQLTREVRDDFFNPHSSDSLDSIPQSRTMLSLSVVTLFLALNDDVDMAALQDPKRLRRKCQDTIVHIAARCGGLLEISRNHRLDSYSGREMFDAWYAFNPSRPEIFDLQHTITYFHSTARSFLESESSRLKIMQNARPNFIPGYAIVRSYIRALRLYPISARKDETPSPYMFDEPQMEETRSRSNSDFLVRDIMAYIRHAEDVADSSLPYAKLLHPYRVEMMPLSKIRMGSPVQQVVAALPYFEPNSELSVTFLQLAVVFDLRDYVSDVLLGLKDAEEKASESTKLLHFLLQWDGYCTDLAFFPLPSPGMVSLLLDNGADPNAIGHFLVTPRARRNLAPFECAIWNALSLKVKDRGEIGPEPDHMPWLNKELPEKYIRIAELLAIAGANTQLRDPQVFGHLKKFVDIGSVGFDVERVVKEVLWKPFPVETCALLRAIGRARRDAQ